MLSNDVFDTVYTLVKSAMGDIEITNDDGTTSKKYENLSYSRSTRTDKAPELPCLYIRQIGAPQIGNDLVGTDQCAVDSTFQVESYSNISYEEAFDIINDAGDIFNKLGYSVKVGVEEDSSSTIWRFYARFNRIVGAGDVLTL